MASAELLISEWLQASHSLTARKLPVSLITPIILQEAVNHIHEVIQKTAPHLQIMFYHPSFYYSAVTVSTRYTCSYLYISIDIPLQRTEAEEIFTVYHTTTFPITFPIGLPNITGFGVSIES